MLMIIGAFAHVDGDWISWAYPGGNPLNDRRCSLPLEARKGAEARRPALGGRRVTGEHQRAPQLREAETGLAARPVLGEEEVEREEVERHAERRA